MFYKYFLQPVNQMINQMDGLQVGQWSQQESNMWNQQSQINQQSQQMAAWKFVLICFEMINIKI